MDTIQNGYLVRYSEQNMALARTVVVKIAEAADLVNEGLVATYGGDIVDTTDPTTWKYYQNLSGVYHSTDAMMSVVSIDTLETIDFTLQNLMVHTATAEAFAYGTRQYNALVARYPTQELLINGILTPVDIDTAIAAPTGAVLTYPAALVESNEVTLIAELEAYLVRNVKRWYNTQYAMSDNLFIAAFVTVMSTFILPKLLNLRLARCKTEEAHSFHVRMYLASHSRLDQYLPYLNLRQTLWLYRNLNYLERHPGTTAQFATLMQKLLTERGIPLGEYSVRHLDKFTADYLPVQTARLKWLNADVNSYATEYRPVETVLEKEADLAIDNSKTLSAHQDAYLMALKTSSSAVIQTKILNSSMVDYADAVPEPFEEVALRQWCYMATHDLYPVSISFKDPKTSEVHTLFAKDAFFYLYYIQLRADGLTLDTMPDYLNMQQRRNPKPSVDDLLSVTDTVEHDLRDIAVAILAKQPNITTCYSVSAFYAQTSRLTEEAYWHWFLISSVGDYYERAMVENMVRRLYENVRQPLVLSTPNVSEWLAKNNLPEFSLDHTEALALIKAVFEAGTGLTVDNAKVLKNIQKAMLDIMKQLSSYSVQFIREINTEDIIPLNWPAVRFGKPRQRETGHRFLNNGSLVYDSHGKGSALIAESSSPGVTATGRGAPLDKITPVFLDSSMSNIVKTNTMITVNDIGPTSYMSITYPGQNETLENDLLLPGYTTFNSLPESARAKLKSH